MKISAISDVHVKKPHDPAFELLISFLTHPLVKKSDYVMLLGDIFDLMCGPHGEYLALYEELFSKMDDLYQSGVKLYFFEGNHDIHLEKLFKKRWPRAEIGSHMDPVVLELSGKKYYFSHGDEHEVQNSKYQKYKSFIASKPLKFVANFILPYKVLTFVGERASAKSRKRGSYTFDESKVRETFREGVEQTTKGEYDFVLGGHSHVQDQYVFQNGKSVYLNNGYALKTKTFIYIDDHQSKFSSLG